jgi:DnaJ-class molecular chaperone
MSFEESLRGRASFQIRRLVACTTCSGWGGIASGDTEPALLATWRAHRKPEALLFAKPSDCAGRDAGPIGVSHCRGRGWPDRDPGDPTPPGVYDGYRLIVPGKGMEGRGEVGPATPDPRACRFSSFVSRSGDNLYCTVPVTFTERPLDADQVPTVDGPVKVRVQRVW